MVKEWEVEIPALTGEKKRKAYIYLPEDYESDLNRRYPVLYMFDGHNLFFDSEATFGKSWGLKDYLDATRTPLIIAAVECNHDGAKRLSEYSPVTFTIKTGEKIRGRGQRYMDWLVGTFKPFIDENYRTLPERADTAVGGSSMGGLMTLYALAKYNKYFSRGAALSPSLWVANGEVPEFIQKGRFGKDCVVYIDYGSKELTNHEVQRRVFRDTVSRLFDKKVNVTGRIVPGGTHTEASWEKQIALFMRVLGFNPET